MSSHELILARILLLQNMVFQFDEQDALIGFVCRGLEEVPGVAKARFSAEGTDPPSPAEVGCFPLKYNQSHYGEICLNLSSQEDFKPYHAYISNLCFMIAVILEERRQNRLNQQYRQGLEILVDERTKELKEKIVEQKRAEERALQAQRRAEHYLDISEAMILELDRAGKIKIINKRGGEILGYRPEELIGQDWFKLCIPPHVLAEVEKVFQQAMAGEADFAEYFENEIIDRSGARHCLAWHNVLQQDDKGQIVGVLCSGKDITEYKHVEQQLQESKERLALIIKGSNDAPWDWDLVNNELYYSSKWWEQLGYGPNELAADTELWERLLHPDDRETVKSQVKEALEGATYSYEIEFRLKHKKGHYVPVLSRGFISRAEDGKPVRVSGTNMDLTERKHSEEERLKLEKQMVQTQKLESLGILAGGIAHDFNNLLAAILGHSELTKRRLPPESAAIYNLNQIEQAAERAADLAKQMLAYSGRGKFVIETINLNKLLEEMLNMLHVSISKKAVLRINPCNPLPAIEADATQIRQIIMNLVINASEAIGEKSGTISITTGCVDNAHGYLKDVWLDENLSDGLYVYLEIADTGCGMDKETLERLFDPFFTTKFTGRGLGMSAVMGIVRGHKGAIKVYSEPGEGTTFKILLPTSDKPVELFNGNALDDDWQGEGKVLIADDEETVRGVAVEMLKELGFSPFTATDGRDALQVLKEVPDIKLVILDLTMPKMDGEQCFREIRKLHPDVKVIISSGFNEYEVSQKFIGKGIAGFVQKPYKLSVLQETIKRIVD